MLSTTLLPFVLPCDLQVFTALQSELHNAVQPQGALEQFAFERLVNTAWNMRRVSNAEMALLNHSGLEDPLTQPGSGATVIRYAALTRQLESSYRLTFKELIDLQTARALRNPNAELPPLADPIKLARLVKQTQANTLRELDIQWKSGDIETQQWLKQARNSDQSTQVPTAQHSAGQSQPTVRPTPKIGRNELCPCGSGQKFKRCCGNPVNQSQPNGHSQALTAR